jgi:hypothetical protein
MSLYQLNLEERSTCPRSCQQWKNCYGNNMPFAKRIDARSPDFGRLLQGELRSLAERHPDGFVVRLHVLGDFFSKGYVALWKAALVRFPGLHIFGYTHRRPEDKDGIGQALAALNDPERCWIRFSDRGGDMSANLGASRGADDIQCPQEIGKTKSCLTCGLCWQTTRAIGFLEH